jgi:hypothetical protein
LQFKSNVLQCLKINCSCLSFMSIGWDYVFEVRPPTGLLFILQTIHEYGQPQWNDTDRGQWKNLGKKPVPVPLCPP